MEPRLACAASPPERRTRTEVTLWSEVTEKELKENYGEKRAENRLVGKQAGKLLQASAVLKT